MKSIALTSISRENRDVWPPLFVVPSKPINLSIYKRLYQFSGRRVRHILAAVPIGHHCINSRVYYRWNSLRGGTCRCQADTDFHSTQKAAHTHTRTRYTLKAYQEKIAHNLQPKPCLILRYFFIFLLSRWKARLATRPCIWVFKWRRRKARHSVSERQNLFDAGCA